MKRVDRLLIKVQEACRLDTLQLSVAVVEKNETSGKYNAVADLWDGKTQGEKQRLIMECDTEEAALKAVEEVQQAHTPTGNRARATAEPVIIYGEYALED